MPQYDAPLIGLLRIGPLDDALGTGKSIFDRVVASASARERQMAACATEDRAPPASILARAQAFLAGVFAGSSFLAGLSERSPDLLLRILAQPPGQTFADTLQHAETSALNARTTRDLMAALRQGKTSISLLAALADLGGVWNCDEVTAHLSDAAQCLVSLAVRFLLSRAQESGKFTARDLANPEIASALIVLAMGKFGARELNYSSDIDLIIFYDRETAPLPSKDDAAQFYVRLTRDLVHILQERTADGYVFRTDLRLRPDPASTQAAISTGAAFRYYETFGQNWERAAYIKARPIAGDIAAGETFLKALEPYVWRKYLDYNAIADIHAMKRQIHAAKGHGELAVAGHNLKVGRGGIREIEFFVQSQQLIAGGRQQLLRSRGTIEALNRLTQLDWIGAEARDDLTAAYRFLRGIEHRLQMVADQQTHTLPSSEAELERFSRFAGYSALADFERDIRHHMLAVQTHYAALFEEVPELTPKKVSGNLSFTGDDNDPSTMETLATLGFKNPAAAIASIKGWHYGRYRAVQSARAREILTEFTPALLEALAETSDPDLALATFDHFLSELPAALQLFSTLRANPPLLQLLAIIMGTAPRLARILSRRRRLMDAILDPGFFGTLPARSDLDDLLKREVLAPLPYEERLNRARIAGEEQSFLVGAGLLSGTVSPREAGEAYSLLAEATIETLLEVVQAEFGTADFPPPAIIAMGKLGGREMTAASDLDLIVVYDAEAAGDPRAAQHYARWTQRLISALAAQTSEGQLYPVDMRLRPSGKAGPLAVGIAGFSVYQLEKAWTWEHLALTRARVVAGPVALRERLESEILAVLKRSREREKIAGDVRDMRILIAKEKPATDLWDMRNATGGLLDVEFIAQYLQLVSAASTPVVLSQNTIAALQNLGAAGLLDPGQEERLLQAAELYQSIAQVLRLCTDGGFRPGEAPRDLVQLLLEVTSEPDMSRLEARIGENYAAVAGLFIELVR